MFSRAVLPLLMLSLIACSSPRPPADSATPVGPITESSTDADRIRSARTAAPESLSKDATIGTMEMRGLHVGTNQWTCYPDSPAPGLDPMCVDHDGDEWVMSIMHHGTPEPDKLGVGYMLMGGADASLTDPFAATPKPGEKWIVTGPRVMILNIGHHFDGYPTTAEDPTKPFVMYANTPYARLIIPLR
jgi:hypothetical protein